MNLRERFLNLTGEPWENSQGEPDIDYVNWLEGLYRWIPKEERLPLDGQKILITNGKLVMAVDFHSDSNITHFLPCGVTGFDFEQHLTWSEVTHWQELPGLPEIEPKPCSCEKYRSLGDVFCRYCGAELSLY